MSRKVCEHYGQGKVLIDKYWRCTSCEGIVGGKEPEVNYCGQCGDATTKTWLRRIFWAIVILNILVGLGLIRSTAMDLAALKIADNLSHKQLSITRLVR